MFDVVILFVFICSLAPRRRWVAPGDVLLQREAERVGTTHRARHGHRRRLQALGGSHQGKVENKQQQQQNVLKSQINIFNQL